MNNNNTAVEKDKAGLAFELNEKFRDCKTETHEYLIGKQRCVVVRHYCGDKDLNEVFYRNAFERAFSEVMALHADLRQPENISERYLLFSALRAILIAMLN